MKINLNVRIGALKLKNPVMVASGTFGESFEDFFDLDRLGAIVMKTITLKARIGNPPPRVVETASGMLNSIGLENKGLEDFIENKVPLLNRLRIPVIASIAGDDKTEFSCLAKGLDSIKRVDGLELNLSCPNIRHGNYRGLIAQDEKAVYEVVKAVRKTTTKTLIVKLAPNVTDITSIARSAESAGADALLLINTIQAMAVDIKTRKPRLGNMTGGLSGPAIKPIALKMVWDTYNKVKIPIIGVGGIMDYKDALEFILSGASAIQVGTANFVNPAAPAEIIGGLKKYLAKNKISDITKLVGDLWI